MSYHLLKNTYCFNLDMHKVDIKELSDTKFLKSNQLRDQLNTIYLRAQQVLSECQESDVDIRDILIENVIPESFDKDVFEASTMNDIYYWMNDLSSAFVSNDYVKDITSVSSDICARIEAEGEISRIVEHEQKDDPDQKARQAGFVIHMLIYACCAKKKEKYQDILNKLSVLLDEYDAPAHLCNIVSNMQTALLDEDDYNALKECHKIFSQNYRELETYHEPHAIPFLAELMTFFQKLLIDSGLIKSVGFESYLDDIETHYKKSTNLGC